MSEKVDYAIQQYRDLFPESKADETIAKMAEVFMPLVVTSHEDKDGYSKVRQGRLIVREHRIKIEKTRKELKADALEYSKVVDGEARRLTTKLEAIETHLQTQEDVVGKYAERQAAEKARLEAEAQVQKRAELEVARVKLEAERAEFERQKRVQAEKEQAEARKLEAERAALEQAKRDHEAQEQTARRAAEVAVQKQKDAEEFEKRRQAMEEDRIRQAEKRAAEEAERKVRAEQEAKERAEREASEREAKKEAARLRKEANAPDKDKILKFAELLGEIEAPECKGNDGRGICIEAMDVITDLIKSIEKQAATL